MRFLRRLTNIFRRHRLDDDIAREMAFHLEMEAAERQRRGESVTDARRLARAHFGSLGGVRDAVHDARGLTFWEHLVQDTRFGVRLLLRQPGFTAVAVLILSLGIGANTAIFSVVNTLILKPRPWHAEGEILGVFSRNTTQPDEYRGFSYPDYVDMRSRTDVFASLTVHNFALVGVSEGDVTRRVIADVVTASFFDLFGSPPILGRPFTLEEERPGADIPVTILSYAAWHRMGARRDIIGTRMRLNAREFEIVGVAPKAFGGSIAFASPDLWLPTGVYDTITNDFVRDGLTSTLADRGHHTLLMMARLRPGVEAASLGPALESVTRMLAASAPVENKDFGLQLAPLARMSLSTKPVNDGPAVTSVSIAMLSMGAIVLLVASFNLANMLLAQSGARRKEFAIRLAIGGGRGRLVRQLLTEGMILALLGAVGGFILAGWATRFLVTTLIPLAPVSFWIDSTPDWRMLTAMIAYCTISTVVFALAPARRLAQTNAGDELKGHATERFATGRWRVAMPSMFVMAQLALCLVLLSVAALFMRGATEAAKADPGFTFDRGVLLHFDPSMAGYPGERSREIFNRTLDRVRARPDVAVASVSTLMPFGEFEDGQDVQRAGAPVRRGDTDADANLISSVFTGIGTGYFDALGLSLVAGRDFTGAEERTAAENPRIAIVNVPLARKLFGDTDPIGRSVQYSLRNSTEEPVVMTVVGVAPGVRQDLFDPDARPQLYVPFASAFHAASYVHVRTRAASADAEAALLPGFRQLLTGIDARLPILAVETRAMYRDRNLLVGVVRIGAAIFTVLGVVALLMAAFGVYGVKSYLVTRRTREIGVRIALGATPRRVVWVVVRDGLVASLLGLAAGLGLSAIAGSAMRNITYQGRAADAAVLGVALAVLTAAALLASWLPARRATKITPLAAMRQ